ncbi:unnamed protein product [Zymoseptoria tritici ST99CH_1E4]|uniref:Uncharacterized protein n=1 Tax=Zymoseptoria tritici ST99CH_1E4 TaxID=1276532 RepID=A0A2H1G5Q7_ZYMTR|nr:unnamed protein product [Zymoseptoria tritici ST99CH_1E4]
MKSIAALTGLIWLLGACTSAVGLQTRAVNATALQSLPQCASRCLATTLPAFECGIQEPCFCNNNDLSRTFSACISSGCATLEDRLETQRFHAETCSNPLRDRSTLTRGVVWALFGLTTLFLAFRILSRSALLHGRGYSWDDFVVLLCFVMLVPLSVSLEFEIRYGLGKDAYRSSISQISALLHWYYFGELLYVAIVMLAKVAVVLLYLRIWTNEAVKPGFRLVCWATIAVLLSTVLAFDFALIFQCSPISYAWTKVASDETGRCVDISPLMYTFGALDICFNLLVFVLPSVFALSLSWKNKFGVSLIFLVGLAVTAAAAARLQYQIRFEDSNNTTWNLQYVAMWSFVESALSIMCTCMPAIVGLIQRIGNGDTKESDEFMTVDSNSAPPRQKPPRDKSFYDRHSLGSDAPTAQGEAPDFEKGLCQLDEEDESPAEGLFPPARFGEISIMRDEPESNDTAVSSALAERKMVRSRHLKNQAQPLASLHYRSRVSGSPKRVEISHDPPSTPSEAKMTYRDEDDILHEVTITDIPQERQPGPFHSNWKNGATRPRAMRAITEADSKRNSRVSGGGMTGPKPTGENIFAAFRALSPVSSQQASGSDLASSYRNASSSPGAESSSGYVSAHSLNYRPSFRSRSASTQTEDRDALSPDMSRGRSPGDAERVPPPVLVSRSSSSTQTDLLQTPLSPPPLSPAPLSPAPLSPAPPLMSGPPLSPLPPIPQSASTQTQVAHRGTSRSGFTQTNDDVPRRTSRSGSTQTDIVPRNTSRSGSTQTEVAPRNTSRSGFTQTEDAPRRTSRSGFTQTEDAPRRTSRSGSTQTDASILPGLLLSPRPSPRPEFDEADEMPRMGSISAVRMGSRGTATRTEDAFSPPTSPVSSDAGYSSAASSTDAMPPPVIRTSGGSASSWLNRVDL